MEIMDPKHIPDVPAPKAPYVETPRPKSHTEKFMLGYIYLGLFLIACGVIWMLHNFEALNETFIDIVISMPMLMVAGGGFLLCIRKYIPGGIVGGVGLVLLILKISETPLVYIVKYAIKVGFPLAVIIAGIVLIVTKLGKK